MTFRNQFLKYHLHSMAAAAAEDAGDPEQDTSGTGKGKGKAKTVDEAEYNRIKAEHETLAADLEKFKTKHAEAEKHRKEQEEAARKAAEETLRKSGDIEALEKSWQEKLNGATAERETQIKTYESMIQDLTVGSEASRIASEIALEGSADVLMPHIRSRLSMELRDGKPVVKVMVNGKPSALSLDELKAEFVNNKAFAPIIKGSSASGAGGAGQGDQGNNKQPVMKRAAFDQMTPTEQAHFTMTKKGKVVD